jgi:hypothetical protein
MMLLLGKHAMFGHDPDEVFFVLFMRISLSGHQVHSLLALI